jgi:hypothetical protein
MTTDVSAVRAATTIALMVAAARTSEPSVDIQLRRRQYIPEDSELHTRRRENLKSHRPLLTYRTRSYADLSVGVDVQVKKSLDPVYNNVSNPARTCPLY